MKKTTTPAPDWNEMLSECKALLTPEFKAKIKAMSLDDRVKEFRKLPVVKKMLKEICKLFKVVPESVIVASVISMLALVDNLAKQKQNKKYKYNRIEEKFPYSVPVNKEIINFAKTNKLPLYAVMSATETMLFFLTTYSGYVALVSHIKKNPKLIKQLK